MKHIEMRMLAGYRRLLPERYRQSGSMLMEVEDGLTLDEVLGLAGVCEGRPLVVLVNGRHSENDSILNDGDVVSVFPPVAGG